MKKNVRNVERKRRTAPKPLKWVKWLVLVGLAVAIVYGFTQMSGVAYNEEAIAVVDFTSLTPEKKHEALVAANAARCTCSCGMTLAQCVSIDSTCPVRANNIERIKTIVRDAAKP